MRWRRPRRREALPRTVLVVLATPIALGLVAAACDVSDDSGGEADGGSDAPENAVEVVVAASPEKLDLLTDLAEEFNSAGEEVDGKPIHVTIRKSSSGSTADRLVEDWPTDDTSDPPPTVYSPAASLWGPVVNERRARDGKAGIVGDGNPIMLTPVVIAMPEPMAEALGWPENPIGWADIVTLAQDPQGWAAFGHPEWGDFKLGKTDPNESTTGFNTTIAQAYAGTGKQRDLTTADLADPAVQAFLSGVESSVVHYGDTTLTFLNNLYNADQRGAALGYVSAVAVEEKSVIDYNNGNPDGIAQEGETPEKPRVPLVAVYPKEGTLWSDNPYFVLDADWVTDEQKDAAAQFGDFVIDTDESQERVLEYGFRPASPTVALGEPIDAANGLDPTQPRTILPVPDGETLFSVLDTWQSLRKTARVLLVLDVSGSMGDLATADDSKLDLAKQAVQESLDLFEDRDEVGLWIFSTELDGSVDHQELAPVEPIGPNRDRLDTMVDGLFADGGTGLYDTVGAAVDTLEPQLSRDRVSAVVVLTDGRNEDDNDDLDGLVRSIGGGSEATGPVRVFAIAYGDDASISELTEITEATSGALYRSTDPEDIASVFRSVVSNF